MSENHVRNYKTANSMEKVLLEKLAVTQLVKKCLTYLLHLKCLVFADYCVTTVFLTT
jgi:hypothetical protein